VLVDPQCGEEARQLLRSLCPAKGARPRPHRSASPLRRPLPLFASPCGAEAAREAASRLPLSCAAEILVVACEAQQQRKPPASYVLIGPVAVVSLDERLRGREREVAEQLLRSVPGIVAVYGKEETAGEHRVQRLRLLAGKPVEEVVYVEHGLRIPVRLGRVYINPRLATEHRRVAEMIRPGERVLDMFSGVGGFSLAASATGRPSLVVANDANPYAVEALLKAIDMNKRRLRSPIIAMMADAAKLPQLLQPIFTRIIMNLPHSAKKFLPAALRLCSPGEPCTIHLYTVARSPEEALTGLPQGLRAASVTRVLDYAPRKYIYRVDLVAEPGKRDSENIAPSERGGEEPPQLSRQLSR